MNPDQPSREQIEARITALLLGELPAEEAALLRYTIAQDPALQKLHDQLQSALPLVREAAKHPADAPAEKPAPLKMSADRREKLLAHFRTPRPEVPQEPLFWLKRIEVPRLISVLTIVAVIAFLAAMMLPVLSSAKRKAQYSSAENQAKEQALGAQMALDDKRDAMQNAPATPQPNGAAAVANTAPNSQAEVTLGPEPKIAPPPPAVVPPTQIVLPQPESTSQMTAQAGVPANTDTGGVYSQSIVGYVNLPAGGQTIALTPASGISAMPPASPSSAPIQTISGQLAVNDTDGKLPPAIRQENVTLTKQWKVPSQAIDSNGTDASPARQFHGGIGGAGGGGAMYAFGGATAGNRDTQLGADKDRLLEVTNSAALAWDDSSTDRSRGNNQSFGLLSDSTVNPKGSFPGAESTKTEGQTSAGRTYYRNVTRQPDGTENKKIPALAQIFQSHAAPSATTIVQDAKLLYESGNYKAAETNLNEALTLDPANETAAYYLNVIKQGNIARDTVRHNTDTQERREHVEKQWILPKTASDSSKIPPVNQNDPAWAGLLERPDEPRNSNIHFISRYPVTGPISGLGAPVVQTTNYFAFNGGENATFNPGVSAIAPVVTYDLKPQDKLGVPASTSGTLVPTPQAKEEMLGRGEIDFQGIDLSQALDIYAKLANRTVLRGALPQTQIILNTQTPLTKPEAIQALQTVLALNGISLVNVGDKFVKVLPSDQAGVAGGEVDRNGSTNAPALGSYVTQVVQLKYVKPTEILQAIRPFANLTNSILPMDSDGIIVLRDNPENVERMLKMIQQVDVSVPAEYISEIIPIRYAKVDDIAGTLNELDNKEIQLAGQMKMIANEDGNSLLVYATRSDMVTIKSAIEKLDTEKTDLSLRKPAPNTPLPQPEILTSSNAFSTFSLNVSDVSFKLAEASLENGKLPDTASIRSEEFINAFNYRDPEAAPGQPMAFTSERAAYPFAHNRDLLRFSIKTAAAGRQEGRPLNLVLLLDTSGSMERADRVQIIHEALRVLTTQLHENDIVSVVSFARTARLWADGVSGGKAGETLDQGGSITPEGGTNLEEAMRLAYETAHRHYLANGMNRVVLLTDGAANLGNVEPGALKEKVEAQRKQGIALDCFGIGWEDLNDDLLEELSSNGDGRYAFLNSPEDAAKDFGTKLAGALQVAAQDVKVQVEFNPQRVISYRQIGYAKHQLTKQQFRDNTVAAGEIAAQEAGNALYTIETNPNGDGPIATVHVRYRIPGTQDYHEHSWDVAYTGNAPALDLSSPAMRLATTASAFSEWLAASAYAQEVTPEALAKYLTGVPEVYGADDRPKQLETMIREAKSLEGK